MPPDTHYVLINNLKLEYVLKSNDYNLHLFFSILSNDFYFLSLAVWWLAINDKHNSDFNSWVSKNNLFNIRGNFQVYQFFASIYS